MRKPGTGDKGPSVLPLRRKGSEGTEITGIHLLRAEEVAKMLGCSKWYVYALAARGELPCVRIGRLVRFEPEVVVELVNQRRQGKEVPCEHPQEKKKLPDRLLLKGETVQRVDRPLQEGGGSQSWSGNFGHPDK